MKLLFHTKFQKVNTRREINLINALMEYELIELLAPPEL